MNQILLTSNQSKKKKSNNYNDDTRKIIIFFSIAILIFGIAIAALYGYKVYKNNNPEEVVASNPTISIEEIDGVEDSVTVKVTSSAGISTITYTWNDEESEEIQMNGRTSNEEQIEVPEGENTLTIKVVDVNGLETETSKTFSREESTEKPTIELDDTVGDGKLKITVTDDNGIQYITYAWNDEEATTIKASEEGQTTLETEIDIQRGKNTLTITAVNTLNAEETIEKIYEGVNNPVIEVVKSGDKLYMTISHDMGFEKIEFLVNGVTYVYDENFSGYDSTKQEIEYYVTLQEGENTVIIVATSMEGTEETYRGKCTYTPE